MLRHSRIPIIVPLIIALALLISDGDTALAERPTGMQAPKTWQEDARDAALSYADEKAKAVIKKQSKAAIIALYKRIYRSGADKRLVRTLGTVALSAQEIDAFAGKAADALATGNPESVKAVSGDLAVALGGQLARGLKDPRLRMQMTGLLGSVDKVNELAGMLGSAAGGDSRAAMEYVGRAFMAATPAAGVIVATETAVGAMRYAHGKFVDSTMEDLYRRFAAGDEHTRAGIRMQLETLGLYSHIVRHHRMALAAERADAISRATAQPSDAVLERLTTAHESEIIDDIMQTFAARAVKEEAQRQAADMKEKARAEARTMLDALEIVARDRYGRDWWQVRPYNLHRYTEIVAERLERDGVLDPSNPTDIRAMSRLLATRMVHGENSTEYLRELAKFKAYRRVLQGDNAVYCDPESDVEKEADDLWSQALHLEAGDASLPDLEQAFAVATRSLTLCPDTERRQKAAEIEAKLNEARAMSRFDAIIDNVRREVPSTRDIIDSFGQ